MVSAPSAIMLPQLGRGGATPMPRKDSDASSRSTLPTLRAADTMIGAADIDAAHQNGIDPAPVVTGDCPDARAQRHRDERPERADAERNARAVGEATPYVSAEDVGAHQECQRRWVILQPHGIGLHDR